MNIKLKFYKNEADLRILNKPQPQPTPERKSYLKTLETLLGKISIKLGLSCANSAGSSSVLVLENLELRIWKLPELLVFLEQLKLLELL